MNNVDRTNDVNLAKFRTNYSNLHKGYLQENADEMRAKILNSANTEENYEIKGTKYFVSENGDDNNDGLSPDSPVKTLEKIESLNLEFGDAILFERDSIFRFSRPIRTKDGITYGSYGEGLKPAFYGSPENFAESDNWTNEDNNIWKIPFDYKRASGFVINYSMIIGVQKRAISELTENGDYYHDLENKIVYTYCDLGNPSDAYQSIEICPARNLFDVRGEGDLVFDNLCLKYAGGFGMSICDSKPNVSVTNCEFGFLGGLWMGDSVRFGNAVEFWSGLPEVRIENITVRNNWFYQIYDTALSWQGDQGDTIWKNIDFSENLFEYNNADIEFWCVNGCSLEDFRMNNNIMRFTSMGWGTRINDGGIRGIEGCIRGVTGTKDSVLAKINSEFIDNLIDCPARQIINWNIRPEYKEKIIAKGTKLYVNSDYRTLDACIQGLQIDLEKEPYDLRIPAKTKEELENIFTRFENGAEIHWDE